MKAQKVLKLLSKKCIGSFNENISCVSDQWSFVVDLLPSYKRSSIHTISGKAVLPAFVGKEKKIGFTKGTVKVHFSR
jgi:hypothetical protein